jgi:hypothetical protein
MAPEQVMPAIESYATGDMPARVAAFSCLKYYVSRELESDSLVIPRAIEMVAVGLGNAEPANWAEGDDEWPQKIRLASIQSFTAMLSRPAVRSLPVACCVLGRLIQGWCSTSAL